MTDNGPKNCVDFKINPILANLAIEDDDPRELVILYGYIGKVTEDKVRFYQGLRLGTYFEISRDQIIHTEPVEPTHPSSITKIVVFKGAELTLVKTSTEKFTAGQLERAIDKQNRVQSTSPSSHSCHCGENSTSGSGPVHIIRPRQDETRCLPECVLPNGRCGCLLDLGCTMEWMSQF